MQNLSADELSMKAAQLRQMADRMEQFAKKERELERERQALMEWLSDSPEKPKPSAPKQKKEGILKRRNTVVKEFLAANPGTKRTAIFEALDAAGIAPASPDQLSPLLSRMKSEGEIVQNANGGWELAPVRNAFGL
jgi:predicted transcriptional regulator